MFTRSKRYAPLALALGLVVSSLACENWESNQRKADRRIAASVKKCADTLKTPSSDETRAAADLNRIKSAKGGKMDDPEVIAAADKLASVRRVATTQKLTTVSTEYVKTLKENDAASLPLKIQARSGLALAGYEMGDLYAQDLSDVLPRISRQMWEISQTASQIVSVNEAIKAAAQRDPSKAPTADSQPLLTKIADSRTKVAKDADEAAAKIKGFQDEIAKIKGQVSQLQQQKDALVAQADADGEKASKLAPKEATPLQASAIEARRKASNIGHEIDKVSAPLLPLERDLATEQARKKNFDDTLASLDENKKTVEANWQSIQQQMEKQKELATQFGQQLKDQAAELGKLEEQARDLRKKATDIYKQAATDYAAADKLGGNLNTEINSWMKDEKYRNVPESKAWKDLQALYSRFHFLLRRGQITHVLATISADQYQLLAAREKLIADISQPLKDAGVALPAELEKSPDGDAKTAQEQALKQYASAIEIFAQVYDSPVPNEYRSTTSQAARISAMFSNFGDYILSGTDAKLQQARNLFNSAFGGEQKDTAIAKSLPAQLRG